MSRKEYNKANFRYGGETRLHRAVINGDVSEVLSLLERGAIINVKNIEGALARAGTVNGYICRHEYVLGIHIYG